MSSLGPCRVLRRGGRLAFVHLLLADSLTAIVGTVSRDTNLYAVGGREDLRTSSLGK